jgi:hypothetical protein
MYCVDYCRVVNPRAYTLRAHILRAEGIIAVSVVSVEACYAAVAQA